MDYIQKGTNTFRRTSTALFAGGFTTFAIMYSTQPLLPEFSMEFHISPAVASLSISLTTISLAASMLIVGSLSEVHGRKALMIFSLFASSVLAILTAFTPNFNVLLIFRILQGIVLAGLPAIAMAYLSEEVEPASLGMAMGLYISGNSIGGMGGRIIIGTLAGFFNWHIALGTIGILGFAASLMFWRMLPPSRNFYPRPMEIGKLFNSLLSHIKDPGLLCIYGIGFLLMSCFVSLYNYISYQLIAPPYSLSQKLVGWIFIVYIVGTFSSSWMGRLADKHNRRIMLLVSIFIMLTGACTTLSINLIIKITGIILFTFGFFGGHSIASSAVGHRALHDKAQASSLYLFFYYFGSSIGGTLGGIFWAAYGWIGVVGMIVCFLLLAVLFSVRLSSTCIINPRKQEVKI